jgi:hypothetical protein
MRPDVIRVTQSARTTTFAGQRGESDGVSQITPGRDCVNVAWITHPDTPNARDARVRHRRRRLAPPPGQGSTKRGGAQPLRQRSLHRRSALDALDHRVVVRQTRLEPLDRHDNRPPARAWHSVASDASRVLTLLFSGGLRIYFGQRNTCSSHSNLNEGPPGQSWPRVKMRPASLPAESEFGQTASQIA